MADAIWIVIVNYRTADLAIDCLRSIAGQLSELPELHAVVVDNASGDGSAEKLGKTIDRENWHGWASVLPQNRNGGFAFGNNAGIRVALQSASHVGYVMLLNPDTIVRSGAIRTLIDRMESRQRIGIAGSLLEKADGTIDCSAHNAHSPLGELESGARLGIFSRLLQRYAVSPPMREAAHECDWVSGASLMIRRAVFEEIGLLDENYFLYFEEADFCRRAREAGWEIWFVPESRIVHLEGASTGIQNISRRRPQYWYPFPAPLFRQAPRRTWTDTRRFSLGCRQDVLALRRMLRLGSGEYGQDPKWFAFDLFWGDLRSVISGKIFGISRKDERL